MDLNSIVSCNRKILLSEMFISWYHLTYQENFLGYGTDIFVNFDNNCMQSLMIVLSQSFSISRAPIPPTQPSMVFSGPGFTISKPERYLVQCVVPC